MEKGAGFNKNKLKLVGMVKEINPKIIVLLGKTASDNVPRNPKYKYLHIIHPSAAMRFTKPRIKFLEGMQKLKTFVIDI